MRTISQSGQMQDTERRSGTGKQGWKRWVRTIALGAVALALTSTLLVAGSVAKARLLATHPPIGILVDVGGYRMHITCQGAGSPTVILEGGAGGFSLHWRWCSRRWRIGLESGPSHHPKRPPGLISPGGRFFALLEPMNEEA